MIEQTDSRRKDTQPSAMLLVLAAVVMRRHAAGGRLAALTESSMPTTTTSGATAQRESREGASDASSGFKWPATDISHSKLGEPTRRRRAEGRDHGPKPLNRNPSFFATGLKIAPLKSGSYVLGGGLARRRCPTDSHEYNGGDRHVC